MYLRTRMCTIPQIKNGCKGTKNRQYLQINHKNNEKNLCISIIFYNFAPQLTFINV